MGTKHIADYLPVSLWGLFGRFILLYLGSISKELGGINQDSKLMHRYTLRFKAHSRKQVYL